MLLLDRTVKGTVQVEQFLDLKKALFQILAKFRDLYKILFKYGEVYGSIRRYSYILAKLGVYKARIKMCKVC